MATFDSCCFGVVAARDQQCDTFIYENSSCPESWHYWGNSCYNISETTFTWADAKDECRNLGGVLGVPSSDPEHEFIAQLIPTGGTVWLDCTDIDVGGTGSAERDEFGLTDLEVEGTLNCRESNVEVAHRNWARTSKYGR
ncbi:uncharacterized protein [Asterias amurensis]|uniref:uncharacterized protein n=1 Tax=Asterias amurensis TaxID=7602 RepID=UPI003AB571CD